MSSAVEMIVVNGIRYRPEDAPKRASQVEAVPEVKKEPVKRKPRSQGSNK